MHLYAQLFVDQNFCCAWNAPVVLPGTCLGSVSGAATLMLWLHSWLQNRVREHSLPGLPISIARYNCGGILRPAELGVPWEFQLFTVQQYATWGGSALH